MDLTSTLTNGKRVLPCFFPTTVGFIDDDQNFLDLLTLNLDPDYPVRTFESPLEALDVLSSALATTQQPFDLSETIERFGGMEQTVSIDLSSIVSRVFDRDRFNMVSVLVVDYEMPEMNGLEFCRQLADLPVRKLLLTGEADESLAVEAFHERIIHGFISKRQPEMRTKLASTIRKLQLEYFSNAYRLLADTTAAGPWRAWSDPGFAELVYQIGERFEAVEFYSILNPIGILMLSADAKPVFIALATDAQVETQIGYARLKGAPESVIESLQMRRNLLIHDFDQDIGGDDWAGAMVTARRFSGRGLTLYYSLIEGDRVLADVSPETVLPLRRFLSSQAA